MLDTRLLDMPPSWDRKQGYRIQTGISYIHERPDMTLNIVRTYSEADEEYEFWAILSKRTETGIQVMRRSLTKAGVIENAEQIAAEAIEGEVYDNEVYRRTDV